MLAICSGWFDIVKQNRLSWRAQINLFIFQRIKNLLSLATPMYVDCVVRCEMWCLGKEGAACAYWLTEMSCTLHGRFI